MARKKGGRPKRLQQTAPPKHKVSTLQKPEKFNLTPVQRVQVEVIDWKRCSVRALLLLSYVTLIHFIVYLIVLGYGYWLINESGWLFAAFFGFFVDLGLYFFGSGAALKAITYVWQPLKFFLGILAIIIGIIWNVCLYFIGTHNSGMYRDTILPLDCKNSGFCGQKRPVEIALICIPLILPPVALICVICACVSAYHGIYIVPKKMYRGQVDAIWLEPYETYDFYVGRNIPKIPGYDEVAEEHTQVSEYFIADEEEEFEDGEEDEDEDEKETEDDTVSLALSEGSAITPGRKPRKSRKSLAVSLFGGEGVEDEVDMTTNSSVTPTTNATTSEELDGGGGEDRNLKKRKSRLVAQKLRKNH